MYLCPCALPFQACSLIFKSSFWRESTAALGAGQTMGPLVALDKALTLFPYLVIRYFQKEMLTEKEGGS